MSLPSVESNGTDYWWGGWGGEIGGWGGWGGGNNQGTFDLKIRIECNAKTQSWTDPGRCLDKCSKKKKCPIGLTCLKVCLLDRGFDIISVEQTSQTCKNTNMVPFDGSCLPTCKKNSDCNVKMQGVKSNGCKSVCAHK